MLPGVQIRDGLRTPVILDVNISLGVLRSHKSQANTQQAMPLCSGTNDIMNHPQTNVLFHQLGQIQARAHVSRRAVKRVNLPLPAGECLK